MQLTLLRSLTPLRRYVASFHRSSVRAAAVDPRRSMKVSHILLDEDDTELANKLERELEGDASRFERLAEQHSQCPSSARGGDIGWIGVGQTVPEFERAAYDLPVGGLGRVKTQFGLHLITVKEERMQAPVLNMSVESLGEVLSSPDLKESVQLVDVREQHEAQIARLPGFKLYPTTEFHQWSRTILDDLDRDQMTVVLCHHGVRSMHAARFLADSGFTEVWNVDGGIDAYSQVVDASVPRY